MGSEIVQYQNASIDSRKDYARTISTAGDMLPKGLFAVTKDANGNNVNAPSPGKVLLVLETGAMLGIHPMAALQGINVIEGRATISPAMMTAILRKAGHKIEVRLEGTIEGGDIAAIATLTRKDDGSVWEEIWTPFDALRAGLIDSYQPDGNGVWAVKCRSRDNNPKPWETYTKNMLRWRAIGDVAKFGANDELMGMYYTPEELGSTRVDEDGGIEPTTVVEYTAQEDEAITRIRSITDRSGMAAVRSELIEHDIWTVRVESEFAAHLITLPDSRAPQAGAPGQTGDPRIDGLQRPRVVNNIEDAVEVPDESPMVAAAARGAAAAEARQGNPPEGTGPADTDYAREQQGREPRDEEAPPADMPESAAVAEAVAPSAARREVSVADSDEAERADLQRRAEEAIAARKAAAAQPSAPLDMSALEPKPEQ